MTRYQVEHIAGKRGGRTKYTCPMCTTLKTHGVCYKPDDICGTIRNPLSYYKRKARILTEKGPKREPSGTSHQTEIPTILPRPEETVRHSSEPVRKRIRIPP